MALTFVPSARIDNTFGNLRMDIRQLKYFIAVAEEGHIGRAAARLHLSQPALSRQIQLMEAAAGAELVTRTPRGVALTQVGEILLRDARQIVQLSQQSVERLQQASRGTIGRIDIGVFGTVCFDYVPRLLTNLHARYPAVTFAVHSVAPDQLLPSLRQHRVSAMFERMVIDEPDIASVVAARESLFLAVREEHPLARQDIINVASLRNEPMVVGRVTNRVRGTARICEEHGFPANIVAEADNLTMRIVMVASGIGSCIVPRAVVNLRIPGVVYRPLRGNSDLTMDVYCYYLHAERSPVLQVLLKAVSTPPHEHS
jgi:LysR family transcriptional regulator, benzoate and cis,cis-muconate-responsive activator of ben and cat genes